MGLFLGNNSLTNMVKELSNPWTGDYRKIFFENTPSNNGWYRCARCGKNFRKEDIEVDHIIPRSKGGGNDIRNLQALCLHCNRSKRDDMKDTMSDLGRRNSEEKKTEKEMKNFEKYLKKKR